MSRRRAFQRYRHDRQITDIAEMLGVSKTPVREALKSLVGTGLVMLSPLQGRRRAEQTASMSLADREFHRALYLGCGNRLPVVTLDGLGDQTALIGVSGRRDEADEHRAILSAARAGDAEAASRRCATTSPASPSGSSRWWPQVAARRTAPPPWLCPRIPTPPHLPRGRG